VVRIRTDPGAGPLLGVPAADAERDVVTLGDVTDAALIDGCRRGQPESWDQLVRRYERLVYSVALRSGLNPTDASDVTQGTFIALLDACGSLRDDERIAAWLITVARRKAWRVVRRQAREFPHAEVPAQPLDQLPWEDIATLHDALHQLGIGCRELLHALYFDPERPSYAEIATRFGRSIGGIGPMRGRCLERIRALMTDGEA
jgi:RNA polymerase sigma factor (sigma-70 family)